MHQWTSDYYNHQCETVTWFAKKRFGSRMGETLKLHRVVEQLFTSRGETPLVLSVVLMKWIFLVIEFFSIVVDTRDPLQALLESTSGRMNEERTENGRDGENDGGGGGGGGTPSSSDSSRTHRGNALEGSIINFWIENLIWLYIFTEYRKKWTSFFAAEVLRTFCTKRVQIFEVLHWTFSTFVESLQSVILNVL